MTKTKKQPDPDIVYKGTQITLPEDPTKMALETAIEALQRKAEDEKTLMDVSEVIEHHPYDALVALNWAMKEIYGWASPQAIKTFFGDIAPDMVKVPTGPKDTDYVQVPCGKFKLPNVTKPIHVNMDFHNNCLMVTGTVRKADKEFLVKLANVTRERLKEHSIFRGKAINIPADDDGDPRLASVKFLETDHIQTDQLILNPNELSQIDAALWTPIRHTDACVENKIPLNRGVLLEGTYGTGKSMTAHVTSRVCVDNNWTFILLDDVRSLKDALIFAQKYEPCVIFAEDIDRVAEERDQMGNDILNTIDGILTKHSRVITVLTTNYVEKLDRAMLRPGRLDAVVSIRPPEPEAVKALIRQYGGPLIDPTDTLEKTADILAGQIPAVIREVTERSKLGMISRGGDHITDKDLHISAMGMQGHLKLLQSPKPEVTPEQAVGDALSRLLGNDSVQRNSASLQRAAGRVEELARHISRSTSKLTDTIEESGAAVQESIDEVQQDTTVIRKSVTAGK